MEIIEYSSAKHISEETNDNTISCTVEVFDTSVINTTTIWFIHHTNNIKRTPTSTTVDRKNRLITANLNLHHHHGIYECITRATLSDNPSRIYNDSKMLHISLPLMKPIVKTIKSRSGKVVA